MSRDLEKQLSSSEFDKNAYLRHVAFEFDSAEDLEKHKHDIQLVAEKTAQKLKQNVYQNYALFIDTSREISSLEAEMYQLSHLLNDHQVLTKAIQNYEMENNVVAEIEPDVKKTAAQEKHGIAQLLELVEGCSTVTEVPGRHLIYSSVLEELDPQTFEKVHDVRGFLLNDSLMLATSVKAKRKGPVKYHFQALYELDNLAVIDIKDTEKMKHLFEVRMFPDSHMFQAESEAVKLSWIVTLEETKQSMAHERNNLKQVELAISRQMATRRRLGVGGFQRQTTAEISTPEWVKDAPEQIDVFIAQREFDKAVDLIDRLKGHVKDATDQMSYRDVKARTSHRINRLSEVLMNELKSSTSGSLRGGPRAARRAVGLLLRLGRASKACELFLQNHSHIVEHELKQIKLEGATAIYISNVSSTFFTCLQNAAKEFDLAFGENCGSYSAFMVWCVRELDAFLNVYCIESIFPPVKSNLNFSMLSECVSIILKEAETLNEIGIDLGFKVTSLLHDHLSEALSNARELLEDKLSTMGDTELWNPMDCRKNQAQVAQIILHLENMGVPSPSNLVENDIVDMSKTTFTCCQSILHYTESFLKIYTPALLEKFVDCLSDLFRHIVNDILETAFEQETLLPKTDFLMKNYDLLIKSALPAIALKIQKITHQQIPEFTKLQEELVEHIDLVEKGWSQGHRGKNTGHSDSEMSDEDTV